MATWAKLPSSTCKRFSAPNSTNQPLNSYSGTGFTSKHLTTLGLDSVHSKYVDSETKTTIPVILWDTAGQERFRTLTYNFYKNANAVLLVYDVTERDSFTDLRVWMAAIREHAAENIKMVLVANKVDEIERREVTRFEGQNAARENGMTYFEVSAK